MRARTGLRTGLCLVLTLLAGSRRLAAEDVAALRRAFAAPAPAKTLNPLFWLHGEEDEAAIRQIIAKMDEGGCSEFTIESRPHKDYLGKKWWSDLAICLDEAEKRGMKVWIFDEKWFPSGVAGGLVVKADPRFARQYLVAHRQDVKGAQSVSVKVPAGDHLVSIVVGKKAAGRIDPATLRVIPPDGVGPGGTLRWAAPAGDWSIFCFVQRHAGNYIDSLSSACLDKFVELTHQATYERFKDKFGKTIQGFFTDEPGFHNGGGQFPWTFGFLGLFKAAKGYDLEPLLPALMADVGPETHAIRFDYWDYLVTRYAEVFYKKIGDWCHAHGVRHIGHLYEHSQLHYSFGAGPGHFFRTEQYMDMGGIDVVFYQVGPGSRNADYWGMPKLASSVSHIYGKPDDLAMDETYGAYGWRCGLTHMKWLTDWQCVRGINVLVPHAFNPKWPDEDCPPFFYARGRNPQWVHFRRWADHTNRVCALLQKGKFVADAIVLYPAESRWVGQCEPVEDVEAVLQQGQVDFDIVPYELWTDPSRCRIDGRRVRIQQTDYKVVVLPGVTFIPLAVLQRLGEFVESGGMVIASRRLPARSCDRGKDAAVQALVKGIWDAKGIRRGFLAPNASELKAILRAGHFEPDVAFRPDQPDLRVLHRKRAGADIYFVTNESIRQTVQGELTLHGTGCAEWWDPMTGQCRPIVGVQTIPERLLVPLRLAPYESGFVVVTQTDRRDDGPRLLWADGGTITTVTTDGADVVVEAIAEPANTPANQDRLAAAVQVGQTTRFGRVAKTRLEARTLPADGWTLQLGDAKAPATLGSWTSRDAAYSGVGTYRRAFSVPAGWIGQGRVTLDLGDVQELAEVRVNGKSAGVRICPPYVFDVTALVSPGANALEVDVINTASNYHRAAVKSRWAKTLPSGLIGPVSVRFSGKTQLRLMPSDTSVPAVLAPAARVRQGEIEITWRSVLPSLGTVVYGQGTTLNAKAAESGAPRTYHSVALRDLTPNQEYRARVDAGPTPGPLVVFKTPPENVLSARFGARTTASSVHGPGFPPESVIDGDRVGAGWHHDRGGWNDATQGKWPDWIAIGLPAPKQIGRVEVFTLQDAFPIGSWVEPTEALRFTKYGIVDFEVQLKTNAQWQSVGRIRDNDRVWRTVTFDPRTATAVRVVVHAAKQDYSRIVEIEAYAH